MKSLKLAPMPKATPEEKKEFFGIAFTIKEQKQ